MTKEMEELKLCGKCQGILAKRYNTLWKFQQKEYKKERSFLLSQLNHYILLGCPVDNEEYSKSGKKD